MHAEYRLAPAAAVLTRRSRAADRTQTHASTHTHTNAVGMCSPCLQWWGRLCWRRCALGGAVPVLSWCGEVSLGGIQSSNTHARKHAHTHTQQRATCAGRTSRGWPQSRATPTNHPVTYKSPPHPAPRLLPPSGLTRNQPLTDREDASSTVTAGATANTTEENSRASRESGAPSYCLPPPLPARGSQKQSPDTVARANNTLHQ